MLASCTSGNDSGDSAGETTPFGELQHGIATYYDFADGSGNCGFDPTPNDLNVAAVNNPQYNDAALCGRCAKVDGPNGSVTVRLVDRCPECLSGHLDLSPEAFQQIADLSAGRVDITWTLVTCAVSGPVQYLFKDGSSQWWTAVQVRNHKLPITGFEVDKGSGWQVVQRLDYNYFVDETGFGAASTQVRITAVDGQQLVDTLPPVQALLTVTGAAQFQ
jgi:expansin (peptidoglycan-binding protein)